MSQLSSPFSVSFLAYEYCTVSKPQLRESQMRREEKKNRPKDWVFKRHVAQWISQRNHNEGNILILRVKSASSNLNLYKQTKKQNKTKRNETQVKAIQIYKWNRFQMMWTNFLSPQNLEPCHMCTSKCEDFLLLRCASLFVCEIVCVCACVDKLVFIVLLTRKNAICILIGECLCLQKLEYCDGNTIKKTRKPIKTRKK